MEVQVVINGVEYVPKLPDNSSEYYGDSLPGLMKRRRKHLRLTLREAAAKIGMSISHLHTMEGDGHIPNLITANKISEAYGLPLDMIAEAAVKYAKETNGWQG